MKVKEALLQQLVVDGLSVIFGNPGSTEEGLIDVVGRNGAINYVLGLQEASVVAMADGWARVTRRPAIVQLHSAVGLGNGIGVLYEAYRSHTPLVVVAGETYSDLQAFDGFLACDLTEIAKPVTKLSCRVTHGSQMLRILRRAIKVASTYPKGPVFMALPMDVLEEEVDARISPTNFLSPVGPCSDGQAEEIARRLVNAKSPMLLVGDGVAAADAQPELCELADLLACPIWGVEFNDLSVSFTDSLFLGTIGHSFGEATRVIVREADAILAIGTPLFPELFPSREEYFSPGCSLMQIDFDPWEIAKNFPVHLGLQANPKSSLGRVIAIIKKLVDCHRDEIEARRAIVIARRKDARKKNQERFDAIPDTQTEMAPGTMMRTIVEELPKDCLIYDESITSTPALLHYLQPSVPGSYILARGGCIGVGWPGAVGASFAKPEKTVLALSADGSAIFGLQSLWTAARYRRKVIFVVCNNRAYRILKVNLLQYWRENNIPRGVFPFMDLDDPNIEFAQLAHGFGIPARKVVSAEELRSELRLAFAREGPSLIDVSTNGSVTNEM